MIDQLNRGWRQAGQVATVAMLMAMMVVGFAAAPAWAGETEPFPREWFWGDAEQRAKQDELIGKPAPPLDLSHWMNGEVTAEQMKGKIVVVDFWATWCGPCIRAIPKNNTTRWRRSTRTRACW